MALLQACVGHAGLSGGRSLASWVVSTTKKQTNDIAGKFQERRSMSLLNDDNGSALTYKLSEV